jgi:hypothetical protein
MFSSMRTLFIRALLCALSSLLIMTLPVSAREHMPPHLDTCRGPMPGYQDYLSSYDKRIAEEPEALTTVRPLTAQEYDALVMALELLKSSGEAPGGGPEGRRLCTCCGELTELLLEGRIKGDDDPFEKGRGTKMTTHKPMDPEDPFDGDIYIHEGGLLENVFLPQRALAGLTQTLPESLRLEKARKYMLSLVEGAVLLSSYLVHECTHRGQAKFSQDPLKASPRDMTRYVAELEDPAYTAQLRYLLYLYRITDFEGMREIVRATGNGLIMETNALFPGLKEFQGLQRDGMWLIPAPSPAVPGEKMAPF